MKRDVQMSTARFETDHRTNARTDLQMSKIAKVKITFPFRFAPK